MHATPHELTRTNRDLTETLDTGPIGMRARTGKNDNIRKSWVKGGRIRVDMTSLFHRGKLRMSMALDGL